MKIISIKKRPWYARVLSINHWAVSVEIDGVVRKYNCWAGLDIPTDDRLLFSLREKIKGHDFSKNLIGKEI